MTKLQRTAIVTGASSGIGQAIATSLAEQGHRVWGICRRGENLPACVEPVLIDLNDTGTRWEWHHLDSLDVLVHAAGVMNSDLDEVYRVHVRAPLTLTRQLLPALRKAEGQVVFLNSSLGRRLDHADPVEYAAAKHALRAIADGMRASLNPAGIRVVSLYLGRTATPMQEQIHQKENRSYHPERLIQPTDVAKLLTGLLTLPKTAEVTDVWMRPMLK